MTYCRIPHTSRVTSRGRPTNSEPSTSPPIRSGCATRSMPRMFCSIRPCVHCGSFTWVSSWSRPSCSPVSEGDFYMIGRRDFREIANSITAIPRAALLHPPCSIATPSVQRCYTPRAALLHPTCSTATPPVQHCYTLRAALLHPPRSTATPPVQHCYTLRAALLHPPRSTATPTVQHCYTLRAALLHPLCSTATPVVYTCASALPR